MRIVAPGVRARAVLALAQRDARDKVDEFAQHDGVERGAAVVLGQDALERGVDLLDGDHRFVDQASDGGLLGIGLQMRPAGFLRNPEDVLGEVFVGVLGALGVFGQKGGALGFESVRDVLEEDQAEDNVLVIRRLHVAAQLVGGLEEAGLDPEVRAVVG
jgi:hypothetical protein